MSRFARKVDANHAEIVKALREAGFIVRSLAALGDGMVDLLVGRHGKPQLWLLEVKDGNKAPSAQKLKPKQEAFIAEGWPVHVVKTPWEAIVACATEEATCSAPS